MDYTDRKHLVIFGTLLFATILLRHPVAFAQFRALSSGHSVKRQEVRYVTGTPLQTIPPPTWARRAYLRAWGAGGGAGGSAGSGGTARLGGKGGAGGYVSADVALKPGGSALSVIIGKGGSGGPNTPGVGKGAGGGEVTTIAESSGSVILVRAGGGGGGGGAVPSGFAGGAGGAGGGAAAQSATGGCPTPDVGCSGGGKGGSRAGGPGAAGFSHGTCPYNGYRASGDGQTSGPGGIGGTCFLTGSTPPNFVAGNGRAYYDNGVLDLCTPGAGGSGYPAGGAGGVEGSTTTSCAGGGGGAGFVKATSATFSVRSEVAGVGSVTPLAADADLARAGSGLGAGGSSNPGAAGTSGGDGLVVIYWY